MSAKQEPRPAYHRRSDLKRLREIALDLPVLVSDEAARYVVRRIAEPHGMLARGRFEVVVAYLHGWKDALENRHAQTEAQAGDVPSLET
jgi:hypothetical protein